MINEEGPATASSDVSRLPAHLIPRVLSFLPAGDDGSGIGNLLNANARARDDLAVFLAIEYFAALRNAQRVFHTEAARHTHNRSSWNNSTVPLLAFTCKADAHAAEGATGFLDSERMHDLLAAMCLATRYRPVSLRTSALESGLRECFPLHGGLSVWVHDRISTVSDWVRTLLVAELSQSEGWECMTLDTAFGRAGLLHDAVLRHVVNDYNPCTVIAPRDATRESIADLACRLNKVSLTCRRGVAPTWAVPFMAGYPVDFLDEAQNVKLSLVSSTETLALDLELLPRTQHLEVTPRQWAVCMRTPVWRLDVLRLTTRLLDLGGSTMAELPVEFGGFWFALRRVTASTTCAIRTFGARAFKACKSLEWFDFSAFSKLTSIDDHAFYRCGLQVIDLGDSNVRLIKDYFANECPSLTRVTASAPCALQSFGDFAFRCCPNLTAVEFDCFKNLQRVGGDFGGFKTGMGCVDLGGSGLVDVGNFFCQRSEATAFLSTSSSGCALRSIGAHAFSGSKLQQVRFCDFPLLESVGPQFAVRTQLQALDFGGCRVRDFGYGLAQNCALLTSVTAREPCSVESFGDSAFGDCPSLTAIDITAQAWPNLRTIGNCFANATSIVTMDLGGWTVTKIGTDFCAHCHSLTHVFARVPAALVTLDAGAFRNCSSLLVVDLSGLCNLESLGAGFCRDSRSVEVVLLPSQFNWSTAVADAASALEC